VPWTGILVIYGVTQIAENLPITPGGIGVVEGALSLMLVAYGMSTDTAVAAVLLYRIISFWLLVPLGWLAAGGLVLERRCERPRRVPAGGPGPAIVTPPLVAPRALP
jgi:putative heme transporter